MHRRRAASLLRPFGLFTAILLATFAGFGPAALANDTGNNGTVKIHEGNTENDPGEVRNEPHVCTFHLHFYFADPEQSGTWEIQEWAPTGQKGTVVLSGTYDTAGDGEDRDPEDGVYTLPDGHYKLFWDGDTSKHDKMKVFWVDCEGDVGPSESASVAPSESASVAPSESASVAPSESASVAPSESASVAPSESASVARASVSASLPGGGELPIVGTPFDGGVAGIDATPPPTDTATAIPTAANDGWRVVLLGLAAIIAAAVFMVPSPRMARVSNPSSRRGR